MKGLIIVDAGVGAAALKRLAGRDEAATTAVVFLGEGAELVAPGAHPWTEIEATRNGGKLAAAAISTTNRLAFAIVEAIERAPFGTRLLDYEGMPLRSLLYSVLADHLFDSLRPGVIVRHLLDGAQGARITFVSPSPKNLALFGAMAPHARTIRTSRRRAPRLGGAIRPVARVARDVAVRGRGADARGWPMSPTRRGRVLFVSGNAAGCEDKHPNAFHALTGAGLDVAVLSYPGLEGKLALPHFALTDAGVGWRRHLARSRHWLRFRRRRAAIAQLLATIPGDPMLGDLVPRVCRAALAEMLDHGLYVALDLLDLLEAGIGRLRPDVVLFDNRHLFGVCTALAARKCGVPTVWAQDGVCGAEEPGLMRLEADVCATWGRATRRYLEGAGVDAHRTAVVGAPFMDDLATRAFRDRAELGAELGLTLEAADPVISYMSLYISREALGPFAFGGNPARHKASVIEAICRTVLSLPGGKLVIKRHPADSDQDFDHAVASRLLPGDRLAVTSRSDLLYDVLRASDLVIIHDGSTTGVEATALGRPVLSVDFNNIDGAGTNSWVREGIALGVHAADEMLPAARTALFDAGARAGLAERREAFLREWVHAWDGGNCRRLVDVVTAALRR